MFRAHVFIVRRAKFYYTVSGIITHIGGRPVHNLCTKFYNKFLSSLYMFRAHVLIVRRAKLYYTVSGIITPIGGRSVHRLCTGRPPTGVMIPETV